MPKLIIFDLDGTLAEFNSNELYPDAAQWFKDHPNQEWCIASNQGGVGLRQWMEIEGFGNPADYPTKQDIERRLAALFPAEDEPRYHFWIDLHRRFWVSLRYQSKKTGKWNPLHPEQVNKGKWREDWRKPAPGMLLAAMECWQVTPAETLMVGDWDEDRLAADAAGCAFQYAWEFFGRPHPESLY